MSESLSQFSSTANISCEEFCHKSVSWAIKVDQSTRNLSSYTQAWLSHSFTIKLITLHHIHQPQSILHEAGRKSVNFPGKVPHQHGCSCQHCQFQGVHLQCNLVQCCYFVRYKRYIATDSLVSQCQQYEYTYASNGKHIHTYTFTFTRQL